MLFNAPSSPNSPKTNISLSKFSRPKAIKSAIARSKCEPFFGVSEGLKFIMIFCAGNLKFKAFKEDFTRSSLSLMVIPAKPTTLKPGSPLKSVDSTSTSVSVSVKVAHFKNFIFFLLNVF